MISGRTGCPTSAHGGYPVTMTWAYLGGNHVQVDLFTMSDHSMGSLGYVPPEGKTADIDVGVRRQITADAIGRGELRAERLFETAPPAPIREPRSRHAGPAGRGSPPLVMAVPGAGLVAAAPG
jgi:hypothetical protein